MDIDTILVPTDFSADSQEALSTARDFAKKFDAKIVILHAYHVDIPLMAPPLGGVYALPPGFYEQLKAQATLQVEAAAQELAAAGVEARGIAVADPAAMAIVEYARSLSADLVVMGTRGLTGLKHVALGSVAERVVRTAPCPVLTVKASD